jgi:nocardicin nonribosomal peptide synthetase NocB
MTASLHADITQVFKWPTVAELVARLDRPAADPAPRVTINEGRGGAPLILIHPAEGLSFAYLALRRHLPGQAIVALNDPHLGRAHHASLEAMAEDYCRAVRELCPEGPYHLGGWSFGGLVSLEMARRLSAERRPPGRVLLLDSHDPSTLRGADVDRAEIEAEIEAQLRAEGCDPSSPEGRALSSEIWHAGRLASRYRPARYDGRVVLLQAQPDARRAPAGDQGHANGWTAETLPELRVLQIPGEHRRIFDREHIAALAAAIAQALA